MTLIGITGGTGCGKTTALRAVRDLGGLTLDCDEIYHNLLETSPGLLSAIEARFPGVTAGGRLQRKRLGALVFSDPEALLDLNRITHPAVKAEILRILEDEKPNFAAIDAIGLFEGGLSELCCCTVAVTAPRELRAARLVAREGIPMEYALSRIDAQGKNADFREKCDYVLDNAGSEGDFYEACLRLFREIIKKENQK